MGTVALVYIASLEGDMRPSLEVLPEDSKGEIGMDNELVVTWATDGYTRDDEWSSFRTFTSFPGVAIAAGLLCRDEKGVLPEFNAEGLPVRLEADEALSLIWADLTDDV